jgi:glycosyltransferase involved in cell wall biosynthesis
MSSLVATIERPVKGAVASGVDRPVGQPVVWFEIEDMLRHFDHFPNPTGIQRFCLEILSEIEAHYGASGEARFCRLSLYRRRFEAIDFDRLMTAYLDPPGVDAPWHAFAWLGRPRDELVKLLRTLGRVPRYVYRIARPVLRDLLGGNGPWRRFERTVKPGDIVVSLGASWIHSRYGKRIAGLKQRHGVKFVQMIHDIIPVIGMSWVDFVGRQFPRWLDGVLPASDLILTVSNYSRSDLQEFAERTGRKLAPVEVLHLGNGFRDRRPAKETLRPVRAFPDRFVMFVSTIERRKNHAFLIGVWQRLVERHGADAVPQLVMIGRPGYMVVDFLEFRTKLLACNSVDGKIAILSDISDTELQEAYRRCLFTLFPSLYEGWGSPVAESLGYGKYCIASNCTSLPEVGGEFCDYFDPTDEADAVAKIERALFEPGYLAAREARVRAEYRPPSWADCAHQMMDEVRRLVPMPQAVPDQQADRRA